MERERAFETQRLALLRMLAGMMFALEFVSLLPAVSVLPAWVRSYVSSVLGRLEAAVGCLVVVSARVHFGYRASAESMERLYATPLRQAVPEGGFSIQHLVCRIAALRRRLNDLPRYAKRLIERLSRNRAEPSGDVLPLERGRFPAASAGFGMAIDRPPDIDRGAPEFRASIRLEWERVGVRGVNRPSQYA